MVSMSRKNKVSAALLLAFVFLIAIVIYLGTLKIPVLQPAGIVGQKERNLLYVSLLLSVVVVVPVFIMLFAFAWKYREGNEKAKYDPTFESSRKLESIWWGIPFAIIFILSIITWNSSHDLDPIKPLSAERQPIHIQVVALQWKWLFIYPDQNIASVNFVQFPKKTPVDFEITSDAPMNSFWIPALGGQIYAMQGMSTHLHLMADENGDYQGKSANISGKGFAKMTFTARSSTPSEFNQWVSRADLVNSPLTTATYTNLAKPSEVNHVSYYSSVEKGLYHKIIDKYMAPHSGSVEGATEHGHGMDM
jgi:cytochrome o ubiquinol oxidase subunit 2